MSRYFNLKDKVDEKHLSNYVYRFDCQPSTKKCEENYVGETGRRRIKRITEHAGKDNASSILKHTKAKKHGTCKEQHFQVASI